MVKKQQNYGLKGNLRSKKALNLLALVAVALLFFSFGYNSRGVKLPSFLSGSSSSSVKLNGNLNVDVEEIYQQLAEKFDGELTNSSAVEGVKKGLVTSTGDPYTTYFTKAEYENFESSLNGQFSGVGAELGKKGEQLVVVTPIDGSPAAKAGVRAGDFILAIDGKSTEGISVDGAVTKIRGKAGTKVKLKLFSEGGQPREVEITRDDVKIDSVKYERTAEGAGYIKVSQFSIDTYSLISRAVSDLTKQGVTRFVLDLRNNGGGYVDTAVNTAGIWMDSKVVLSERFRGKEIDEKRTGTTPVLDLNKTKLVVLVNEGSASASEILAASLRDNAGVKLVGQKTFGKGSVQNVLELKDGGRLKITIAHWFTPKGQTIDKEGIAPDYLVDNGNDGQDKQKQKALELVMQ